MIKEVFDDLIFFVKNFTNYFRNKEPVQSCSKNQKFDFKNI
jgi:hypothetical protein